MNEISEFMKSVMGISLNRVNGTTGRSTLKIMNQIS
jgi:hypothetical protein